MPDLPIAEGTTDLECVPPDQLERANQNPYVRIVSKMALQHRLLSVHWELTYRCNETCTHCYLDVLKPNARVAGELTTAQVIDGLDQCAEMGALNVTFSGGEALVRRDFFEIAEHARRKRFAVRLFTNGILITPKLADRIAALSPVMVELSIYAADPETHDAITMRRRSWELSIRAVKLLGERGVRVVMKTPLMHENVRQLHALRAQAANLGARFRYDPVITAKDNGDQSNLGHRITQDDLLWLLRAEISENDGAPEPIGEAHRSCSIGLHSLVIDPYGNIFPCVQTRISAGNLLDRPLREIWLSSVFEKTGQLTFDVLPVCHTCELNSICHRCHANALVETGDIYAPSAANCREALARRQVMIEKGILPADFPIPAHLKSVVADHLPEVGGPATAPAAHYIPLADVRMVTRVDSIAA